MHFNASENSNLRGLRLTGLSLHGLTLTGLTLHGLRLHGLRLHGLRLHGLRLHGLYLTGLRVTGSIPLAHTLLHHEPAQAFTKPLATGDFSRTVAPVDGRRHRVLLEASNCSVAVGHLLEGMLRIVVLLSKNAGTILDHGRSISLGIGEAVNHHDAAIRPRAYLHVVADSGTLGDGRALLV